MRFHVFEGSAGGKPDFVDFIAGRHGGDLVGVKNRDEGKV